MGAVSIAGLKGDALVNATLKAITKAKRRVTLSICGLGMLDETEIDTIQDAKVVDDPVKEAPAPSQKVSALKDKLKKSANADPVAAKEGMPDPQPNPEKDAKVELCKFAMEQGIKRETIIEAIKPNTFEKISVADLKMRINTLLDAVIN
jgi:hypothetical protein